MLYSEDLFFSKHNLTNPWHLTSPLASLRFSQINIICLLWLQCTLPLAQDGRELNPSNKADNQMLPMPSASARGGARPDPKGPRGTERTAPGKPLGRGAGTALSPGFLPRDNSGTTAICSVGRAEQKHPCKRGSCERRRRDPRRGGDADSPAGPCGRAARAAPRTLPRPPASGSGGTAPRGRGRACSCGRAPAAGQGHPRGARVLREGRKGCSSRLSSQPAVTANNLCLHRATAGFSSWALRQNLLRLFQGREELWCLRQRRRKGPEGENGRGKRRRVRAAPGLFLDGFTRQQFGSNFPMQLLSFETNV